MKIVNEGGLPIIYVGGWQFKDKKNLNIKLFNLKEMSRMVRFEVENFVVKKSKGNDNKMLFGTVVPEKKFKEIQEAMAEKVAEVKKGAKKEGKIILPTNAGILGADGKPVGEKKKIILKT